jgi:hypothetical protein
VFLHAAKGAIWFRDVTGILPRQPRHTRTATTKHIS